MSDTTTETKSESGPNYKKTVNLPKTGFPMKANLIQNEPASLKRWDKLDGKAGLYNAMRSKAQGFDKKFIFHDGPPYANGSIHLGHLMNKCLKDFVVRSKFMDGYNTGFIPGWDCHGLPIEHKVMTALVESGAANGETITTGTPAFVAIGRATRRPVVTRRDDSFIGGDDRCDLALHAVTS